MADGYARATGKVGCVLVTSGPGATNAITGILTAYTDSVPMVIISGQVMSSLIGRDAFQECDMVGISRPVVKHSFIVKKAEDIPGILKSLLYCFNRPSRSCCRRHSKRYRKSNVKISLRISKIC